MFERIRLEVDNFSSFPSYLYFMKVHDTIIQCYKDEKMLNICVEFTMKKVSKSSIIREPPLMSRES